MIHHFKRATRLLIFWSLIAVAVGITSARILLAGIENYKNELERKFRERTDIQLQIGSLSAGMRGFDPEIILRDIDILSVDEVGRPAATLKEIRFGIDVMQLLWRGELWSSSWLTLVGAKVSVIRHRDGSFSIEGLNADGDEPPLWLARAGKYEILQSEIRWQDQMNSSDPVSFDNFNLLIENDDGHHELHLLSDLPEQYGRSLRVSAAVEGDIASGEALSGRLYVAGSGFRFAALPVEAVPFRLAIEDGRGDIELWSEWRDFKPIRINAELVGGDFRLRKQNGRKLVVKRLSGTLGWSLADGQGWRFDASNLQVETRARLWPLAEFHLQVNEDATIAARIPQLSLHELSDIVPFFLATDQIGQLPKKFALDGRLQDFALFLGADRRHYAVNGFFADVAASSADNMPQLSGLSGQIVGSAGQGELVLASQSAAVAFSDLFRDAIAVDRLSGPIRWRQSQQEWEFSSNFLVAENADLEVQTRFDLIIPKGERPLQLELQSAFESRGDLSHVPNYLPSAIMDEDVVDWLDHAFARGMIRNGGLLLSGALNEFPFEAGQGKFEVVFDVEHATLNYHPEWPPLAGLAAGVRFFGDSLRVDVRHAEAGQVEAKRAVVEIPALSDADFLLLDGVMSGGVADGLRFMQRTPLHATVDGLLATAEFEGSTEIDLAVKIPLSDAVTEKVDGVVRLRNAAMIVAPVKLQISDLTGDLSFTENGVFCERMNATMLGFPAQANIATEEGSTRITIDGKSDLKQIQTQFDFLANGFARGEFAYTARLDLPVAEDQTPALQIYSNLSGVTVDLPEPLAKPERQAKSLRIGMSFPAAGPLPVTVAYGDALQMALRIDRESEQLSAGHILFGSGTVGDSKQAGLKLEIRQDDLDLAAWSGLLAGDGTGQSARLPQLNEVAVRIDRLRWKQRSLGKLELDAELLDRYWQGNLSSLPAQGALRIPVKPGEGDKTTLQMAYLDLSKLGQFEPLTAWLSSEQVPLIEIVSERLLWRGVDLGYLELATERRPRGVHFNKVRLSGRDSRIDLTADWFKSGDAETTQVKGRLNSDDFGKLLGTFGYNDDLWETSAAIDFSGNWRGAPYRFSLADFAGELKLKLAEGRISSIEPGFGRLLGLIAMEQWVKRFSLDFSDIYQQGLAFNLITGDFVIREGKAYTDNLLLDAIPARVRITGVADLQEKTFDHEVLVVPKSSDAVPIAGTIVGGIASMVTQALTDDYKEGYFFGSEYRVTGTWDNAEITPLHDRDGLLKKTWNELTDFPWLRSVVK